MRDCTVFDSSRGWMKRALQSSLAEAWRLGVSGGIGESEIGVC